MAELSAEEIRTKAEELVEVGQGLENGVIILKVHQGHIEDIYSETVTRRRPKRTKTTPVK